MTSSLLHTPTRTALLVLAYAHPPALGVAACLSPFPGHSFMQQISLERPAVPGLVLGPKDTAMSS